jgi:hypothetical protein
MSDSYILLLAHFSKPLDPAEDLLKVFCAALAGKIDGDDCPVRSALLLSAQSGIVWARGIGVSEYLVANVVELKDSITVSFEFPRSQPSYLVEISPKKRNAVIDLKKFEQVFEELKPNFKSAECMLLSGIRIVVRFSSPEEAVAECNTFVEPMNEDGAPTVSCRTILIKEHVVMRAFYAGGTLSFNELTRAHLRSSGQTVSEFLNAKFSHFKDRPVVLSIQCPPSSTVSAAATAAVLGSANAGAVAAGGDSANPSAVGGTINQEVNIACAAHFDYRLLRNSPPVVMPNGSGNLVLRVNLEHKLRKTNSTSSSGSGNSASAADATGATAAVESSELSINGSSGVQLPSFPSSTSTTTTAAGTSGGNGIVVPKVASSSALGVLSTTNTSSSSASIGRIVTEVSNGGGAASSTASTAAYILW